MHYCTDKVYATVGVDASIHVSTRACKVFLVYLLLVKENGYQIVCVVPVLGFRVIFSK